MQLSTLDPTDLVMRLLTVIRHTYYQAHGFGLSIGLIVRDLFEHQVGLMWILLDLLIIIRYGCIIRYQI